MEIVMDPFVGEIRLFSYPANSGFSGQRYWLPCDGKLLLINNYQALYALIGKTYGGDGKTNFNLPDLRSRSILGCGVYQGNTPIVYQQGVMGGDETVVLQTTQVPQHTHLAAVTNANATNAVFPDGKIFGKVVSPKATNPAVPIYANYDNTKAVALSADTIMTSGANQGHPNRQPFLGMQYYIAVYGIYPTRP
jgi:microcystin-dependent protein